MLKKILSTILHHTSFFTAKFKFFPRIYQIFSWFCKGVLSFQTRSLGVTTPHITSALYGNWVCSLSFQALQPCCKVQSHKFWRHSKELILYFYLFFHFLNFSFIYLFIFSFLSFACFCFVAVDFVIFYRPIFCCVLLSFCYQCVVMCFSVCDCNLNVYVWGPQTMRAHSSLSFICLGIRKKN